MTKLYDNKIVSGEPVKSEKRQKTHIYIDTAIAEESQKENKDCELLQELLNTRAQLIRRGDYRTPGRCIIK